MKRLFLFIYSVLPLICGPGISGALPIEEYAIHTIVIDAGHGGHDPGCLGASNKEKDIALAIALKLGKLIEEKYPDIKVIYTRKTDVFVELHERAAIANRNKADLFISIHCNAISVPSVAGTETYVMGLHRSESNLHVAKRENAVILMEDDYTEHYDGFDPNSPEAHIIFSLYQNAYLEQSIALASKIEAKFAEITKRKSRGVKQAGFLVLYKTTMPSILIETGFLTNQKEEAYLSSAKGQEQVVNAIFTAFSEFKNEIEEDASIPANEITFKVQIAATDKALKGKETEGINNLQIEEAGNGISKYMVGPYTSLDEAVKSQNRLREQGFKDAFVVSYKKDQRIPMSEAMKLLGK